MITITNLHIHVTIAGINKLDEILALLKPLKENIRTMALSLDALTQAVNDEKTVEQSAIALLNGLTAKIQELINASGNTVDPAALQAVVDSINANKADLATAVQANTPAAPPPAP